MIMIMSADRVHIIIRMSYIVLVIKTFDMIFQISGLFIITNVTVYSLYSPASLKVAFEKKILNVMLMWPPDN